MLVLYDVEHDVRGGEIEVVNGYFVHYLAPEQGFPDVDKHIVFVLDKSGSMARTKIRQLKVSQFCSKLRIL